MNWYKKTAQEHDPIVITSYSSEIGELGISFNGGKTYRYLDVNPFTYMKIYKLLKVKNYKTVNKILKNISEGNKRKQLTQRGYTEREEQEMINELINKGILN